MTIIGPSLTLTGEITSQEDITLHGRVNGQIRMESGVLLVALESTVDADVHGSTVTIQGTLSGSVTADKKLELGPESEVTGKLTAPSVVLQEGAIFNGTLEMPRAHGSAKNSAGLKIAAAAAKSNARAS